MMNSGASTALPWPRCRLWLSVPAFATLLLAVTCWQLPGHSLLWRELQNTGHTVLFAVLALLALCSYGTAVPARRHRPWRGYLAAGAICLLCGVGVEVVQLAVGGDADAMDVLRDLAGILAALGGCACLDPRLARPDTPLLHNAFRAVLLALTAGLGIASAYPLASLAWAYHQREQAYPVIIDLAAAWARPFLQLQHASLEPVTDPTACAATRAGHLSMLRLSPAPYAGFSVIEPRPDWSGHDQLVLDIYSMQPAPLELTLRIHDAMHNQEYTDRYNRSLTLSHGHNRIRVALAEVRDAPAGRELDMTNIAGVMLFAVNAHRPMTVCVGELRLE